MMPQAADRETLLTELPAAMQSAPRWLLWRAEGTNGKARKVPYYCDGARRSGTLDTTDDWVRLVPLETALRALASGKYTGLGFALGPDASGNHWQGIDLDHLERHPELVPVADDLTGYVERSPSGNGIHAIGYGRPFSALGSNQTGIEAYAAGRFFTVTGLAIRGDIEDVSGFVTGTLRRLHSPERAATPAPAPTAAPPATDAELIADLRSAIFCLRADDRDVWVRMGMALKTLGDIGRGLWLDWSATSEKFDPADAARVWDSFKRDGVTHKAVFAEAQRAGWVNPRKKVVSLAAKRQQRRTADPTTDHDEAPERQAAPLVQPDGAGQHFRALGTGPAGYYFFAAATQQLVAVSTNAIGKKASLLALAPLDWWEREFSAGAGFSGRGVDMAMNFLMRACERRGVFSPDKRRGRGVWRDAGRMVIHAGDRLYIDGMETALIQADTEFVYERQVALAVSIQDPLSAAESRLVIDYAESLNFECRTHAILWAGWHVAAVLSGALEWRPHILLNGPKGSGKTSIQGTGGKLLGGFCLFATGGTTAAGLRQALASDALPVIFDEAEGDSQRAAANLDDVLALMRHSSAGFDAKVIKGGADGQAVATTVQSCFCLSAIRDPLHQAADQSRVTVLSLRAADGRSRRVWLERTQPLADRITAPEFVRRLHGRILTRAKPIIESIRIMREAAALLFKDSRMGDQIGTLVGAAWMLDHDQPPGLGEAQRELDLMTWDEQDELLTEASDEVACLRAILEAHIKVDGEDWHGDAAIGELVAAALGARAPGGLSRAEVERALALYGLRLETDDQGVKTQRLLVSNTNGMLQRKIMAHTPWPKGWGKLLARLPGAEKPNRVIFIGGHGSRCTAVPIPTASDSP